MKKFEYKEVRNQILDTHELDALGRHGWEMTAFHKDERGNVIYYFKREIMRTPHVH